MFRVSSTYTTNFISSNFNRKTSEQAKAPSISMVSNDSVHFGMYKKKLKEAETRYQRVMTNKHATNADKREAREYLEEVKKASEEPKKHNERTKQDLKTLQRIGAGVVGAAGAFLGIDGSEMIHNALGDDGLEAVVTAVTGFVTSEVGSRGGRSARKSYSDRLTDQKYPESHYPEEPSNRKLTWGKNPLQYFDKEGKRKIKSDDEKHFDGDYMYDYANDSDEDRFK